MVRLTADLILRSPQYFNAVRQRELDLRGTKFIVTHNLYDTIGVVCVVVNRYQCVIAYVLLRYCQ